MKLKKPYILASGVLALGLAAGGVGLVHAATTSSSSTNPMSSLVNAIAQRFNLNPSDVRQVVDQQRTQMQAQHEQMGQQRLTTMLNTAVSQGKLTQAQADLITAKAKEVESFEATLAGKTPAERQQAWQTEMNSLKQWATQNNIPTQYFPEHGMMGRGHGGHWGGFAPGQSTTGTSSASSSTQSTQ